MTLRIARDSDVPALTALLRRHEATSMFPLANLATAGLDGPGPHGMRFWMTDAATGALGLSRAGMVLPQWPGHADWAAARQALAGAEVTGVIGPAWQVRPLVAALGLADAATQRDATEPGFMIALQDLLVPEGLGRLAGLEAADQALLGDWRASYLTEVTGTPPERAAVQGPEEVARWQAAQSHRVLLVGDDPVAICGFNAALPDVVQVGGVYVPPALRGRGFARRAVALHLAEARARGVGRACLFAVSAAAARAYCAIGFRPTDPVGLVLFAAPQVVSA